uniref:Uncharacterized protein n=1 Tax=Aegilops tauschii subsp. strangulata TaxID=200361 RepID=A0A453DUL5_AEGTS
MPFTDLKNWNCAIGYGVGSSSPLSPSFNFALELVRSSQLVASFYQHHISAKASAIAFHFLITIVASCNYNWDLKDISFILLSNLL